MNTRFSFLLVLLVGVCSSAQGGAIRRPFDETTNITLIISAPDSVKAWRTIGSLHTDKSLKGLSLQRAYYERSGDGVPVATNLSAVLGADLLDKGTYLNGMANCVAQPGVIISFSKGGQALDLYFCFECNILIVDTAPGVNKAETETELPPKYLRAPPEQRAETCHAYGFTSGRAKLLRTIKQIFPDDAQIQALAD